jgi:uncharacterized protein
VTDLDPADDLCGVPRFAPPLTGRVMFAQDWCDIAFLHWPVRPEAVAPLFPAGARPDVWHDENTFVGLVPFAMRRAGFGPRVPVPFFGSFLEWNVRLYSVDDQGRHGVVFLSLDATRFAVGAFAQVAFRIPYRYARIRTRRDGDDVEWRMRRVAHGRPESHLRLRIGPRREATPLETFLTSRWGMHGQLGGRPLWVPNEHGPWPLHEVEALAVDDELVAAAGVVPAGPMLPVVWSPGVHTTFGFPRLGR